TKVASACGPRTRAVWRQVALCRQLGPLPASGAVGTRRCGLTLRLFCAVRAIGGSRAGALGRPLARDPRRDRDARRPARQEDPVYRGWIPLAARCPGVALAGKREPAARPRGAALMLSRVHRCVGRRRFAHRGVLLELVWLGRARLARLHAEEKTGSE